MDFLARELAAAVGLGGRDRTCPGAVTKAVRATLKRIGEMNEDLGQTSRSRRSGQGPFVPTSRPAPEAWQVEPD